MYLFDQQFACKSYREMCDFHAFFCVFLWLTLGAGSSIVSVYVEILQPLCFFANDWPRGFKAVASVYQTSQCTLCAPTAHSRLSCKNMWGVRGTGPHPYYTECLCVSKRVAECSVSNVNEMGSKWWERREVMTVGINKEISPLAQCWANLATLQNSSEMEGTSDEY